jgi:putative nucleotidyltransferase with HDIG domain
MTLPHLQSTPGAGTRNPEAGIALVDLLRRAPLFSPAALRLCQLLGDPEHALDRVIEVVQSDPQLSLMVLKVARSVLFSAGMELQGLQQAIVRLGAVQVLAVALQVGQTAEARGALQGQSGLQEGFWSHSVCTAFAARLLAKRLPGRVSPDQAYTAGLLHDIGRPLLALYCQEQCLPAPPAFRHGTPLSLQEEIGRLGIDHCRAGWELLREWGMPLEIGIAVLHHHHPENAPLDLRPLATLLQLADRLAHQALAELGRSAIEHRDLQATELDAAGGQRLVQAVKREFLELGETLLSGIPS